MDDISIKSFLLELKLHFENYKDKDYNLIKQQRRIM